MAWASAIGSVVGAVLPMIFGGDDEDENKQTVDIDPAHWGEMEWYEQALLKAWYNWLWGIPYTDKDGNEVDPMSYLEMLEAQQAQQQEFSEKYLDNLGDITGDFKTGIGNETNQYQNALKSLARESKQLRHDADNPDMSVSFGGTPYSFVSRPKRQATGQQMEGIDQESKLHSGKYMAGTQKYKDFYGVDKDLNKEEYDAYMKYFIDVAPELAFFEKIAAWANQINQLRYGAGATTTSGSGSYLEDVLAALMGGKMGAKAGSSIYGALGNLFGGSGSTSYSSTPSGSGTYYYP